MDHPPLPLQDVLAEAAWMRRLGRALAGADGDELAQETWVRVLAQRGTAIGSLRGWLAQVMRNLARARARADRRRARREAALAELPPSPSPAALVEHAELVQRALQEVLALEEPLREALLLRYLHGLEPVQIAARLGVPGSTVRTRIARGLEAVRVRLDRRHGGDRAAWRALLVPALTPASAAGLVPAQLALGGLLVNLKALAAFAATALVLLTLFWAFASGEHGTAEQAAAAEPATSRPRPLESRATGTALAGARSAVLPETAPARAPARGLAALRVQVQASDHTPLPHAPVQLWPAGRSGAAAERVATTDAAGIATFAELAPGECRVLARSTVGTNLVLAADTSHEITLTLPPGIDLTVLVRDARERPVPDAAVWLSGGGNPVDGVVVGRSDAQGELRLVDVRFGQSVAARAEGHAPSHQLPIAGTVGESLRLTLVLPGAGGTLLGVVRDEHGAALPDAEVCVGALWPEAQLSARGESVFSSPACLVRCDAAGRFRAPGLAPGRQPATARARGAAPQVVEVEIVADGESTQDFALPKEARVAGTVRTAAGAAVAFAEVSHGRYGDFARVTTTSDAAGAFELGGLAAGQTPVVVEHPEHGEVRALLDLRAGATTPWNPRFAPERPFTGRVVDEEGRALGGWHVAIVDLRMLQIPLHEAETDADGSFVLARCPEKPFSLALRSPGQRGFGEPVVLRHGLVAAASGVVITVPRADLPRSWITGRLLAQDGSVPPQARLYVAHELAGSGVEVPVDAEGRFRVGPYKRGTYRVRAKAAGLAAQALRVELAEGSTHECGTLTLVTGARLTVHARRADGSPFAEDALRVLELVGAQGGEAVGFVRFEGAEGRAEDLPPGTFRLRAHAGAWTAGEREVVLTPGGAVEVTLDFVPAAVRDLRFELPAGDPARHFRATLRTEQGAEVATTETWVHEGGVFLARFGGLLPGAYRVEAETDTGRRARAAFRVASLAAEGTPLRWKLE